MNKKLLIVGGLASILGGIIYIKETQKNDAWKHKTIGLLDKEMLIPSGLFVAGLICVGTGVLKP